jgi:uncharacterized SAM-binding protein YcdF (DUF218 family)
MDADVTPPPERTRTLRRPRGRVALALGVLLFLLGLWLVRVPILTGVARALSVSNPLAPAELIYQFGGDYLARTPVTADLYARGFAPRVVLMRVVDDPKMAGIYVNETDVTVRLLERLGVPRSAIDVYSSDDGVSSTTEEAGDLSRVLRQDGNRSLIAVTSWYHTRRARWALRHALDGAPVAIAMASAPTVGFDASNWWRAEDGAIAVFEEYLKFLHNFLYR